MRAVYRISGGGRKIDSVMRRLRSATTGQPVRRRDGVLRSKTAPLTNPNRHPQNIQNQKSNKPAFHESMKFILRDNLLYLSRYCKCGFRFPISPVSGDA